MRRLLSLTFLISGCIDGSPAGVPIPNPNPTSAPAPQAPKPSPAAAGGCTYSAAIEPEPPAEPVQACRRERVGVDGVVLERLERRVSTDDGLTTTTEESFDAAGTLVQRVVTRRDGDFLTYESLETLTLAADATLPYTYGQSATWASWSERDAAGRVTRKVVDLALDGTVDDEERWIYSGNVATRHERWSGGQLTWTETFRDDGQPLTRLDYGGYGQRWSYGPTGFLAREETLAAGEVTQATDWTMKAAGVPLSSRTVRAPDEVVGEDTWTYDGAGRLDVQQGWGRVYGFDRKHRTDYDDLGREVRYEEDTEEPSCHAYVRTSTFDGPTLVDQLTTCDGALFEHRWSELDAAGRPIHGERIFVGSPTWTVHETETSAYDGCGARTFHERTYGGKVTHRERLTLDDVGRVVHRALAYGPALTDVAADYTYDEAGRVLAMDGRTYSWDAAGRLARIDLTAPATMAKDEAPTASIVFTFACL